MSAEPAPAAAASSIKLAELTDPADPLFLAWLDLWETAFPPHERQLVSFYVRLMAAKARGEEEHHHVLAVLGADEQFLGMAHYAVIPTVRAGFLACLATVPAGRNQGLGTQAYREIIARLRAAGMQALVYEVDLPAEAGSDEGAALAERRIDFYHRQGARVLQGIQYWQDVGPHQPRTPMLVMVHPLREMTADEAFAMAAELFRENITLIGIPALL